MKLQTVFVLGFLGLATLACGGGGSVDYADYAVEITSPWDGMNLPVNGGSVIYSDDSLITVNYDTGDTKTLAASWGSALEKAGYKKDTDTSMAGIVTVQYKQDNKTCVLNVSDMAGMTTVALTLLEDI